MWLKRGCDLGIGSVVLISSMNHLGRVGTAAYVEDLVSAFRDIRTTFGGQIRALLGYPFSSENYNITDQLTIRSLMEARLASTDQRRFHSLGRTSEYYTSSYLSCKAEKKSNLSTAVIPLRLPASLFSKERTSHVGMGWPKLASSLPAFTPDSEKKLIKVMFDELNHKLALKLDSSPSVDRRPLTHEDTGQQIIIVGSGSHTGRLAESLRSTYPEVVDLSVRGWKLNKSNASNLASDIEGILEDENPEDVTVILQLYHNTIYEAEVDGAVTDHQKITGKYHVPGKLILISDSELKELFEASMPIFRTSKGTNIILIGPMPRYAVSKCCHAHIINFHDEAYSIDMAARLKEIAKHIKNMVFTRRLKGVKLVNPIALMGSAGEEALALWGKDPVHPSGLAYQKMARAISDDINCLPMAPSRPAIPKAPHSENRSSTAAPRKSWTAHTQQVASRRGRWSEHQRPAGHATRARGHKPSLHKRGRRCCGGFRP